MDGKIEEMVALGAAYALNCQPCMEFHRQKAAAAGLTGEEMQGAIQVAEAVKRGAHDKAKAYARALFGELSEKRCCPAGSECCP
jgi:AhpD family alkylhydroperoxidase